MAAGITIKHKRKTANFTGGELAAGEWGLNTNSGAWFFSVDGLTVTALPVGGGGGGAAIIETEVDFGTAINQIDKSFTITDAGVSPSSQILANIAYKSPSSGRHIDEVAAEGFDIFCAPGTGNFNMLLRSRCGSVSGKFIVSYLIG